MSVAQENSAASLEKLDGSVENTEKPNEFPLGETVTGPSKTDSNELSSDKDGWLDILGSGHIKKKVILAGEESNRPKVGDNCVVDIVGRLESTGETFEDIKGIEVTVGDSEVIQGIDYALPIMDKGEVAEIFVTSRFGYGDLGELPKVPPKASLLYTVSLLNIKDEEFLHEIEPDRRLSIAIKKKDRGNWWFQRKEYQLAIQCYRKALTYLEPDSSDEVLNENICDARLKTYNNLTIAQLNIEAYDAALISVNHVLAREPNNVKAIFRKVKILRAQGEFDEAYKICKEGLALNPDSTALLESLSAIAESRKKSLASQKVLYRKMFQNPEKSNSPKGKNGNITIVWKWFGLITIAVGVISAVAIKYRS